jgi:hypothetical protein
LKPAKKRGNTSLHQQLEKPRLFYGWIGYFVSLSIGSLMVTKKQGDAQDIQPDD